MQTTFNLPTEIVQEIQLRATELRRDIQEFVVELVASGLASHSGLANNHLVAKTLLRFQGRPLTTPTIPASSVDQWHDLLKAEEMKAEVDRYEKAFGH